MLSSDAGVLRLRGVEQRLSIATRLVSCLTDHRDPNRIDHTLVEMLRLRMFAIAAGYEDSNDCTTLRYDPVFKMALGRVPESGEPLCSQPTMSRLENAPSRTEIARMMGAMVDLFCASWRRAPASIILDTTSMTRSMRFMAGSSSHCSTLITTNAAFCPSISTKAPAASRWR
jgi:hypothetical protein